MNFYGPKEAPKAKELREKSPEASERVGPRPLPCRRLVDPPDLFPMPKIPINIETPEEKPRSGVPPPQAYVATINRSRPSSSTLPEGGSLTGGDLHHPGALHDEEGVVHPRG